MKTCFLRPEEVVRVEQQHLGDFFLVLLASPQPQVLVLQVADVEGPPAGGEEAVEQVEGTKRYPEPGFFNIKNVIIVDLTWRKKNFWDFLLIFFLKKSASNRNYICSSSSGSSTVT